MPHHVAPLSIVDQRMPFFPTPIWLAFPTSSSATTLYTLQQGLKATVHQLPFLSGFVYEDPKNQDLSTLYWDDMSASSGVPWEKLSYDENMPTYKSLASRNMPIEEAAQNLHPKSFQNSDSNNGMPVLVAAFAKIVGGLIVLIAAHHHVMDGGGQEILLRLWAANTRNLLDSASQGLEKMPQVPCAVPQDEPLHRSQKIKQMVQLVDEVSSSVSRENLVLPRWPEGTGKMRPTPPLNAVTKLLRFSNTKLMALRSVLQQYTQQPFSINTLVSALIWTFVSQVRYLRLKQTRGDTSDVDPEQLVSELVMLANSRPGLQAQGLLSEGTWMGNLYVELSPRPFLPFRELYSPERTQLEVALDLAGQTVDITLPSCIIDTIDIITGMLAGLTPQGLKEWVTQKESLVRVDDPSFSYRSLRNMREQACLGLDFVITSWSNFDYYPDFGPDVGRPEFVRQPCGPAMLNGFAIFLPRKRAAHGFSAQDVDAFEMLLSLRRDDLQIVEEGDAFRALLLSS
ncbi:hypothetical protein H2200_011434 [Cladophialophora chaetospira]|uniref:Trichothecene 3-O-acetyltransferase-like N-terminal domain-containing protein n=1 Tax=Cladophialophora chaetospira TaxID=386627 RepID=A0AA38WZA8_9EURO|nr:hypothetical protein H2200_011434 [Cladophialophora chaetospira]